MAKAHRQGRPAQAEGPRHSPWGDRLGFSGRREKPAPANEGVGGWAHHTIRGLGLSLSPVASSAQRWAAPVLGCHLPLGIEANTWQECPGDPSLSS